MFMDFLYFFLYFLHYKIYFTSFCLVSIFAFKIKKGGLGLSYEKLEKINFGSL